MHLPKARRALLPLSVALSVAIPVHAAQTGVPAAPAAPHAALTAGEAQRLSDNANQRIIVILRQQYGGLPARGATAARRAAAVVADQAPVVSELAQLHAPGIHAYTLVNAIAATVSRAEVARLQANPAVQAVVPDRLFTVGPRRAADAADAEKAAIVDTPVEPSCATQAILEPEALQLTNTAFDDPNMPQAQNIVTGTGVTVAFVADGLDVTNPDFIRPDGTPVFTDYQDFTGEGTTAPTGGGEAFGDASSIAAQGNETYNVNAWVTPAHRRAVSCPQIKILGMAPGASLMALKVINSAGAGYTSSTIRAIEYAVTHGANVLNESLGENLYPDNANDPLSLANAAAIAAGVTVVASTGDAGYGSTIDSPATDPGVITAGASTQFRWYQQVGYSGFQLSNGQYVSNNISSLSSAGPTQLGTKTLDVVAPGDLSWEVCTPDPNLYGNCTDESGNPSHFSSFGGTSEAAPLTAGEAALVIQAYRQTHGGASPSPQLVKQVIMSSATDLHTPSYEQGAGLINSLKAVRLATSYGAASGSAGVGGAGLLVSPTGLSASDAPNTLETFAVTVTNAEATSQRVAPQVRTLDAPFYRAAYTPILAPATAPTFIDANGLTRAYVEQTFTVPAGADRLDAAIAWDVTADTTATVRLALLDPRGTYTAYSLPQGNGNGYGHVDVHDPQAGTWTAIIFARADPARIGYYSGSVHLDVAASRFETFGSSAPAAQVLAPGETATFQVSAHTPAQPGDQSAEVVVTPTDVTAGAEHGASVVPIVLRSIVPLGPTGGSFTGTLTGGNGRAYSPGQVLTYAFDVPGGLKDLDLGLSIPDSGYNLQGTLVNPSGLPIDVQSTVTNVDPHTGALSYTNALQFFRRDPEPGRWRVALIINYSISGLQTALPFTATIAFNGVNVQAPDVPTNAAVTLPSGAAVTFPVTVTNTGTTTKDFFVDARLAQTTQYPLISSTGYSLTLPITPAESIPSFYVPTEATSLTVAAASMSPTVPISMDIYDNNGAPPYGMPGPGGPGSPDVEAAGSVDPVTQNDGAVASFAAPEVPAGYWVAQPIQVGPFTAPATPTVVVVTATVTAQQFDPAVTSSTGNPQQVSLGLAPLSTYTPLTLAPGATGTILVTITPTGAPDTVVRGVLYVDAANVNSVQIGSITGSGDELMAIPYAYTIGAAETATSTPTAAASSTTAASATAAATTGGTETASTTATPTGTATPAVASKGTSTATPVPTGSSTGTAVPTETSTSTAAPAGTSTPAPHGTDVPTVTPAPSACLLYVLPIFTHVARGSDQAVFFAASPGAPVTVTLVTRATYPVRATLYTTDTDTGTALAGYRVPNGYRYSFRADSTGLALLVFRVSRVAPRGTVAVRVAADEPCGRFRTVATFEVVNKRTGGADVLATRVSASRHGGVETLRVPLPPTYKLSAAVAHGKQAARFVTTSHGAKAPSAIFTYHLH